MTQPSLKDVERQMERLAAMGACCNFGVAYLMAGGKMPDAVSEQVLSSPFAQLLAKERQKGK